MHDFAMFLILKLTDVSPKEDSNMKTGGVVAAAITVPLVLILIGAMVAYGIYIYKNPEGFGRSTTYKQFSEYTINLPFIYSRCKKYSDGRPAWSYGSVPVKKLQFTAHKYFASFGLLNLISTHNLVGKK